MGEHGGAHRLGRESRCGRGEFVQAARRAHRVGPPLGELVHGRRIAPGQRYEYRLLVIGSRWRGIAPGAGAEGGAARQCDPGLEIRRSGETYSAIGDLGVLPGSAVCGIGAALEHQHRAQIPVSGYLDA
ncbi:hypothetical protein [Nocardia sp. IFM 10818]